MKPNPYEPPRESTPARPGEPGFAFRSRRVQAENTFGGAALKLLGSALGMVAAFMVVGLTYRFWRPLVVGVDSAQDIAAGALMLIYLLAFPSGALGGWFVATRWIRRAARLKSLAISDPSQGESAQS